MSWKIELAMNILNKSIFITKYKLRHQAESISFNNWLRKNLIELYDETNLVYPIGYSIFMLAMNAFEKRLEKLNVQMDPTTASLRSIRKTICDIFSISLIVSTKFIVDEYRIELSDFLYVYYAIHYDDFSEKEFKLAFSVKTEKELLLTYPNPPPPETFLQSSNLTDPLKTMNPALKSRKILTDYQKNTAAFFINDQTKDNLEKKVCNTDEPEYYRIKPRTQKPAPWTNLISTFFSINKDRARKVMKSFLKVEAEHLQMMGYAMGKLDNETTERLLREYSTEKIRKEMEKEITDHKYHNTEPQVKIISGYKH